jgi:hypothetical protein
MANNLEIKKTYTVGGVNYESKEDALKAMAMEVLNTEVPKGLSNVIEKAPEIMKALRVLGK